MGSYSTQMSHTYELTRARPLTPTQTLWNQRGHRLVLLRYAKYCFRSINDTINQNYRDNDTIIL